MDLVVCPVNDMTLVYCAGPYRSPLGMYGVKQNIDRAHEASRRLWAAGYAVICPHANSAYMDGVATDQVFLDGDLEILRRCDEVVLLPNWEESDGARREKQEAEWLGKPIHYWPLVNGKYLGHI